jgi:trans-2,3-dihydro-3-hydroxyanthranilate isomerase
MLFDCPDVTLKELSMSTLAGAAIKARGFDYTQVDVFAEAPLSGNMLAIFTDARGLSTDEMQSLARETNLAETTFILPREPAIEREHGVQVRIFTVQEELRFAGHPTLGTASWLYWNHPVLRGAEVITLDLRIGKIPVRFGTQTSGKPGIFGTMQQKDPFFGDVHDPAEVAPILNLSIDDLDPTLPIQTVSTGMAFCIVPLRSMDAIARLAIPQAAAQAYLERSDAKFFYCVTRAPASSNAGWHARMQFYNGEDPATGSASGCAISYLVRHGAVPSGLPVILEQGIEIHRPSRIHVQASFAPLSVDAESTPHDSESSFSKSSLTKVFVGGRTIPVATGRFFLP